MTTYHITCNCCYQGGFEADSEAEALDAWAVDASYDSYAEMCERLEKDPEDLTGIHISQYHGAYRCSATVGPDYDEVWVDTDGTLTIGERAVPLDAYELKFALELFESDNVMALAQVFNQKHQAIWG